SSKRGGKGKADVGEGDHPVCTRLCAEDWGYPDITRRAWPCLRQGQSPLVAFGSVELLPRSGKAGGCCVVGRAESSPDRESGQEWPGREELFGGVAGRQAR